MKKQLLLLFFMLLPLQVSAYDAEVSGIYYNLYNDTRTAEVTYRDNNYNSYSGSIMIPTSITFSDLTYNVTSIGSSAFNNCSGLTSIEIPYSVTNIGGGAFSGCTGLTSVDIPNSVTFIGWSSFSGCTGLTSVEIPSSVIGISPNTFCGCSSLTSVEFSNGATYIGDNAFDGCSGLTSVEIPNSVTRIGSYAFVGCRNLTSIEIPNSVTSIGYHAFHVCTGLISITISNSVTSIHDYTFYGCSGLTSIEIPNSVTSIGAYAFEGCSGLTTIEIPNSVTSIGGYSFSGCTGLTSVTIGNNVTNIGSSAFRGCGGLTSIEIPNSVTGIGDYAFEGCTGLTSVHITDLGAWCKIYFNYQESNPLRYAKHLYLNGEEVKDLVIPNGVTRIGGFAFYGCSDITSIEIPNSVSTIGDQAFWGCSNLLSLEIPNSVISIGKYTFYNCSGLTSLVIGNNVTSIGNEAFSGCTSISSLYLPPSINSIDESAFKDCTGLESIDVDSRNLKYDSRDNCNAIIETSTNKLIIGCRNTVIPQSVTDYGQYGLANCVNLKLPVGMEEIPINFLLYCKNLESITIPNSIKKIYDLSFLGCSSLKTIIIEDGDEELIFEPTYTYNGYQPKWYIENPLDSIYIGRNYKTGDYTYYPFREHPTLRAVTFGEGIKFIGSSAFSNCRNLSSIRFGSQLETIGSSAFGNSSNLDTIEISQSIKAIGPNAFKCSHISTLIIEDGEDLDLYEGFKGIEFETDIIDSLYLGRSNVNIVSERIKHVTIGKIKKLGVFGGKTINVLDIIEAPDTLRIPVYQNSSYLGGRVNYYYTTPFSNKTIDSLYCNRIVSVYDTYNENSTVHPFEGVASSFKLEIGKNLTEIGDGMFYGCKIPSLFIPNNIKRVSPTAFNNCYTLTSVIFEDCTEPLDFGEGNNFYGCQLGEVYLGRNMQYSTNSPFNRNKESICNIEFGDNVTEIPENAFSGLKNVDTFSLPPNLQKIGKQAFFGCEGLATLYIPGGVTEIGQQAFDMCRGLKSLTFEDGTEVLTFTAPENNLNNAFQNSPLEDIYMGRNISFSNSSPFSIIESLKTLSLGNEVTYLPDKAFIGCPNLKDVTSYAGVVPSTGEIVFTPSYLPDATLRVPYELYNQYKVAPTWKDFGAIRNFEGLYNLTYIVDGEVFKDSVIEQNSPIVPETAPIKEGYTFSGWSEIPSTMPANDVVVTGIFSVNSYTITYVLDGEVYTTETLEYGAEIVPPVIPGLEEYTIWEDVPATMPASDIKIYGKAKDIIDGLTSVFSKGEGDVYDSNGRKLPALQKGLNIIRMKDGTVKKIIFK